MKVLIVITALVCYSALALAEEETANDPGVTYSYSYSSKPVVVSHSYTTQHVVSKPVVVSHVSTSHVSTSSHVSSVASVSAGGCTQAGQAKSPKFDCWGHCGSKGGRCNACGAGGYCCRKGFKDCPSVFIAAAHGRHHSCVKCTSGCSQAGQAKSPKFDCWGHCGSKGGRCNACGAGGYCCRKGFKDCPSVFIAAAHGRHHSCVKCTSVGGCARATPAKSPKFDCWGHCGSKGGRCNACGAGGYCCRKGFKDCPSVFVAAAHGRHHSCVKCAGQLRGDEQTADEKTEQDDVEEVEDEEEDVEENEE